MNFFLDLIKSSVKQIVLCWNIWKFECCVYSVCQYRSTYTCFVNVPGYFRLYDNVHICYSKGFKYNTYIIFKSHAKREVCYRVLLYINKIMYGDIHYWPHSQSLGGLTRLHLLQRLIYLIIYFTNTLYIRLQIFSNLELQLKQYLLKEISSTDWEPTTIDLWKENEQYSLITFTRNIWRYQRSNQKP